MDRSSYNKSIKWTNKIDTADHLLARAIILLLATAFMIGMFTPEIKAHQAKLAIQGWLMRFDANNVLTLEYHLILQKDALVKILPQIDIDNSGTISKAEAEQFVKQKVSNAITVKVNNQELKLSEIQIQGANGTDITNAGSAVTAVFTVSPDVRNITSVDLNYRTTLFPSADYHDGFLFSVMANNDKEQVLKFAQTDFTINNNPVHIWVHDPYTSAVQPTVVATDTPVASFAIAGIEQNSSSVAALFITGILLAIVLTIMWFVSKKLGIKTYKKLHK